MKMDTQKLNGLHQYFHICNLGWCGEWLGEHGYPDLWQNLSSFCSAIRYPVPNACYQYPDYKYDKLRVEAPGEYESYVSIDIDEWIHMKIEVIDDNVKLFVNNTKEPCLIVNDLKHGKNKKGSIGLWTDIGTKGYFKNLRINTTN